MLEQVIFDLAVNPNLRDIYPSWYNTIKFLIDFQPSLLAKIIQFGKIKTGEIKSHDYFRFWLMFSQIKFPLMIKGNIHYYL